jgi:pimeloyl-ACP methyl ester carboxylesterase
MSVIRKRETAMDKDMTNPSTAPANKRVIAEGNVLLTSNRMADARLALPRQLPGIVIFLHGVNDPGSAYQTIEEGLCQGLNERLDRQDLRPGVYGKRYRQAQQADLPPKHPDYDIYRSVKYDPDTYLYARTLAADTHSVFVPFTWGYRASKDQIARAPDSDDPLTLRGQYQDVNGNRLDKHFAKQGGFFANATTTINDMYGPGFRIGNIRAALDAYTYASSCPDRSYFVLAAERLAALIASMRGARPGEQDAAPDETITVIGHSQGTMLALLAQALLAQRGIRTADTLILVDTPYSLNEPWLEAAIERGPQLTTQSRLRTLVNIVGQVCRSPHPQPPLSDLQVKLGGVAAPSRHGGRTGFDWSPQSGKRKDMQGRDVVFAERDNRGKVYLYFCPQDATVAMPKVLGLGCLGVPETIKAQLPPRSPSLLGNYKPAPTHETLPAFKQLAEAGLRQRMWSRALQDGAPIMVGLPDQTAQVDGEPVPINGEPLTPLYPPQMYGGEAEPGDATHSGYDRPDDVNIDTALGNPKVGDRQTYWKTVNSRDPAIAQTLKEQFNKDKVLDDQTDDVRVSRMGVDRSSGVPNYRVYRTETPNETRAWRRASTTPTVLMENSYHSAILRSTENHRWVTAMDVAIGQARRLDDPDWRDLWLTMGDWRMPLKASRQIMNAVGITELPYYSRLSPEVRKLVEANADYYGYGIAPAAGLLSAEPPPLVDRETWLQRDLRGFSGG